MKKNITAIRQKGTKNLGELCSDEEVLLEGNLEILLSLGYTVGDEVDEEDLLTARVQIEEKGAFNIALQYLNFKNRTEQEVREHLKKKGFTESSIEKAVEKLKGYAFVDDQRYTLQFVKDKSTFSPQGTLRIRGDLEKKGISKEQILPLLEEHYPRELQLDKAITLVEKMEPSYEKFPLSQKWEKIGNRLMSKGYTPDVVREALDRLKRDTLPTSAYQRELEKQLLLALEKCNKKSLDDRQAQTYVVQRLMGKGYRRDEILQALEIMKVQPEREI